MPILVRFMIAATLISSCSADFATPQEKVSAPGRYSGYSTQMYDGWVRSSQYVTARDGTRLAVDIFRPAQNGTAVSTPYPVLLSITQYRRAVNGQDGSVRYSAGSMLELVRYGYVVVVADARGKGASFGTRRSPWSVEEARDAFDVIQWTAGQSWSTRKVGMFGASYLAGIQYAAASMRPPALKAIVPPVVPFDNYDVYFGMIPPNGPFYDVGNVDTDLQTLPVDGDNDKALLKAAVEEHRRNSYPSAMPFRDSISPTLGVNYYREINPIDHMQDIERSGVAIYHMGFWDNWLRKGSILGFVNLKNPGKLALLGTERPRQADGTAFNSQLEHLRWFDYWLKGVENGIAKEPPVFYSTVNTPGGGRFSATWPLTGERRTNYYLGEGTLETNPASANGAKDTRVVEYEMSLDTRAEKGFVYAGAPLSTPLEVAGHPSVELWASCTATDGDFIVYLQDVSPDGSVLDVTDGRIRASNRALHQPTFNNLGLPWSRSYKEDALPLKPDEAVRMRFEMLPTSWLFQAGHRMRVLVTNSIPTKSFGIDLFNSTPRVTPAPTVTIVRDREHASLITLPVIAPGAGND